MSELNEKTVQELLSREIEIKKTFKLTEKPVEDLKKIHYELFKTYVPTKDELELYVQAGKSKELLEKEDIINSDLDNMRAGEFRPDYTDWRKDRIQAQEISPNFISNNKEHFIHNWVSAYSGLTPEDIKRVNEVALESSTIIKSTDNKDIIAKKLAETYHELDFLHAFNKFCVILHLKR